MNDKRNGSGSSSNSGGMALHDIYFVVFRNKWKIIILSLLGFMAAAIIYLFKPPTYQSRADLLIKFMRSDVPQGSAVDGTVTQLDNGAEGIVLAEVAILGSFDLAYQVATNIGPAKILSTPGGPNDNAAANAAANRILENLGVDRTAHSTVLHLTFSHADPAMVQPILAQLIENYMMRQRDIHSGKQISYASLAEHVDALHKEMQQTEEELRKAKNAANVTDIDEKKKYYESFLSRTHEAIMIVQADLAEHQARVAKLKPEGTKETKPDAKPDGKNSASTASTNSAASKPEADIPKEKIDEYKKLVGFIGDLNKEYYQMRTVYALHSKPVQEKQAQIDEQEKQKKKMEQDEPRLVDYNDTAAKMAGMNGTLVGSGESLVKQEEAMVEALEHKLKVYQNDYDEVKADSVNLDSREFNIHDLERNLKNQQSDYDYYYTALQKRKTDIEVGAIRDENIAVTQKPTPPSREVKKTPKMMGVAAGAGIALGLAWAFLRELYFDHSVKRAKDVETELGMRLFLSIPDTRRNGHRRKTKAFKKAQRAKGLPEAGPVVPAGEGAANGEGGLEIAPWDHSHSLHPYYEALRDRLISYFEVNNLNHKPKLVAVTGSSQGSGTSTIAAGLAASLSETGDGNVLLIDMNLEQGAAQQFFKGKPHCELDAALEGNTMHSAMIQDNLYVVAGRTNNGDKLSSMLPKRFANLIPKLKASDYDYIIFDMPPISRTGVTQRLAGFMDMMMLIVEAEKTNRDVVRQANALLTESKAKVSVVLNKTRTYVPASLHQEF